MPKGKKRSLIEDREWLQAYEEGKSLDLIAKMARRATSTVWKGVRLARQEREAASVREGLLREAYQHHFEDLLGLVAQIWSNVSSPNKDGVMPVRDLRIGMLLKALEQHLPGSLLWKASRDWKEHSGRIDTLARKTKVELAYLVDSSEGGLQGEVREVFVNSLWDQISFSAKGISPSYDYTSHRLADKTEVHWGPYRLASVREGEAPEGIKELHARLRGEVAQMAAVESLRTLLENLGRARDSIHQEVTIVQLRRFLAGRCDLCPQ